MENWDWGLFPEAEAFLSHQIEVFLKNHRFAYTLAAKIEQETSTRFFNWIDNIAISEDDINEQSILKMGYRKASVRSSDGSPVFRSDGSTLFPILLDDSKSFSLTLKAENLDVFQKQHSIANSIEGPEYSPLRSLEIGREDRFVLKAIERSGSGEFAVREKDDVEDYKKTLALFGSRRREYEFEEKGIAELQHMVEARSDVLDPARIADAFFRNERRYWQNGNNAGKIQKARQDSLGLGWANQDHHTFRTSRLNFVSVIRIFEMMGMKSRERFYAGAQAGWGAQIMEQQDAGIVVFADVDLGPDETELDFAHRGLPEKRELGTVGLWVALHGESILQAGLHHLAAAFKFDALREDLQESGVKSMKPFSDFTFLRQAFTEGEIWKVNPKRAWTLEGQHRLTAEQRSHFVEVGALGSHLENIERNQGFKGFNQTSVSAIIRETDPRRQAERNA
jgi:hypothetical protein